ncbi:MAG: LytTR family transcriptional regulator [Spirochaetes bacterium]|nr:LytTR family transcriptional regulator [Spirochaetota bacterium]MBU0954105.1 LytTR family transcriptional regulator [Spirochaetota bacterium]
MASVESSLYDQIPPMKHSVLVALGKAALRHGLVASLLFISIFVPAWHRESAAFGLRLSAALLLPLPLLVYPQFLFYVRFLRRKQWQNYLIATIILVIATDRIFAWWYYYLFPEPGSYFGSIFLVLVVILVCLAGLFLRDQFRITRSAGITKADGEKPSVSSANGGSSGKILFVRENKIEYRIQMQDIRFIRSLGNYVEVYTQGRKFIVQRTLKDLETFFPSDVFMRVHKSWMVNLDAIDYVDSGLIRIGEKNIPVGKSFSAEFERWLSERSF